MCRVSIVLALVALLAGCTWGGNQLTAGGAATASSASASIDPIPPARDPKNLAVVSPCALLSPAQLASNRIDLAAEPKDILGAPGCEWGNKAHTREINIYVDIGRDVLGNVYIQRDTFPVFEVTQVGGYPAVRTKDLPDGTSCTFRVAAADRQTFVIDFTSLRQGLEEPCGPARALAETVLANLPPLKS